ncbi:MAG TPA: PKD domain-containing protein, partial [Bacteroidia bacterium]
ITYVSKGILAAFGNTNVCLGAATNFSDSSTVCSGVLNSWNWAFGDGNTSALQNPIHTYSATGVYTSTLIVSGTNGAIDTVTHAVNVYALPVSTFSATTVCKGNATQFTDLSTGGAVSWSWNFGDGNTSTIQNPVNTYLASGTYGVSLTVATGNSCQKTIVIPVVVHPLPVANFSASSICVNAPPTTFTDHSTGASQWNWNFGDGNTSTAQNPVHTYSASGNYNATLVATTNFGCTDTLVQSVTVNPAPVAAYSATTVCFNNATIFTDQSTGGTSWSWNFGDGNTSTQQNPSYTYNHDGNFNAMLVVSNSFGCKDSISTTVRVNPLPTVNFTSKPVCLGSNSCFTDSSTISSGNISAWSWNFSDPASGASNVSTVQNPCHVFSTTGNFNVLLTATSNNGCQNMATQTYTVYSFPVASFSASNVCLNDQTIFVSTSTGAAQWDWNFNDGNTSTLQNPSHVYQNYGTFLPTLIATSAGGCKDTISDTVKVYPHPMVNFTSDKVCKGDTTKFNDLSSIPSGNNVGWNWNFGDGSTSSLQNPGHAYSSDGTYSVTLTVTSNQGCTSSTALSSLVYPLPHADFFSTPGQVVSLTDDVAFTDLSSGGVVQWHWHFGNGDSSVSHNPFYIFSDTGTYIVTQIVMSNFGCIDSTKHFIDVKLYSFYIPSAFSPNGDGLNDFFFGEGVGIIQYEMWIFDRWGSLIFSCQTNGLPQSQICKWDGRVKGGGSDAIQQDTYVWKVRLVNVFYKEYSFTGTVSTVK